MYIEEQTWGFAYKLKGGGSHPSGIRVGMRLGTGSDIFKAALAWIALEAEVREGRKCELGYYCNGPSRRCQGLGVGLGTI